VAGSSTDHVLETYRRIFPTVSPANRLISILTGANFRLRSITLAERKAAQARAPVANPYVRYDAIGRLPFLYDGSLPEGIDPMERVVAIETAPGAP
jgi:hypothetical protein